MKITYFPKHSLPRILVFGMCFLFFPVFLLAQCEDEGAFSTAMRNAKACQDSGQYALAFQKYKVAIDNCSDRQAEADNAIKALFEEINTQRQEAKDAQAKVQAQLDKVKEAETKLQTQLDKVKEAEAKLQAQLDKIKAANQGLIKPLLNLFDTYLYQMEYGAADSILMQAIEIDESLNKDGKTAFTEGLMQLIYFYTECGRQNQTPLHSQHLAKALQLCEKLKTYDESYRHYTRGDKLAFLIAVLEKYCPEKRRQALYYRYYPKMIPVHGEKFDMKHEEEGSHFILLSDYDIAETELTVNQYFLFCESSGYSKPQSPPSWGWRGDNPMVYISWGDCAAYINWLTEQENRLKGKKNQPVYTYEGKAEWEWKTMGYCDGCGENDKNIQTDSVSRKTGSYRFPTEAEWQFAAAGGKEGVSLNLEYSGSDTLDSVGWYDSNSESHTHAVGTKKPNVLGLYDMSGNVFEWCQDWYQDYSTAPDPDFYLDISGYDRVLRGGSWDLDGNYCRVAYRDFDYPSYRSNDYGFRPSRTR